MSHILIVNGKRDIEKAEVLTMGNQMDRGGRPFIVVSSVTYALKSRDLLFSRGIKAYVERLSLIHI